MYTDILHVHDKLFVCKQVFFVFLTYDKKPAACYKWNSNDYNFHVVFTSVFQFKTSCNNFFKVLQCVIAQKNMKTNQHIQFIQNLKIIVQGSEEGETT